MCPPCSASVAFGAVSIVAGLTGTLSGSELSKLIGRWSRKAECLVCALSLLGSVPFIFFGLVIAQYGNCMTAAWVSGGRRLGRQLGEMAGGDGWGRRLGKAAQLMSLA